jgi:hypothetical protein
MSVLERVRTGRQPRPPKVVIYGPPKIGKSTFGAGIPDAIFLPTEEGIDALDVASFPKATSFQEVLAYIGALAKEEHTYRALVLDSLDWLEPLIWADVCRENNATSIELVGGGYGKGYVEATKQWRRLLDGLDYLREHKGMTVVLIGHDEIRRMEPPDSEPYDYAALKLHKRAAAIITEWADVIGYAHLRRVLRATDTGFGNKHVRAMSTDEHELVVGANPAYVSGSRYAIPDVLPLSWEALRSALAEALRPQPDAE